MSTKRLSGKVVHDSRGTAVWNWDVATGVLAQKTVAELITTLDAPGMLDLQGADARPSRDWSGDPYKPLFALTDPHCGLGGLGVAQPARVRSHFVRRHSTVAQCIWLFARQINSGPPPVSIESAWW